MADEHHGPVAVECTKLMKRFKSGGGSAEPITAVNAVTLRVEPGSMVAITGASGSGKSTLLHLIGAIEQPDSGSVMVDGTELTRLGRAGLTAYRRYVGFVFQRYHLLPTLTALDNVVAPVMPYRVRYDKASRARELLAAVNLAGREMALPADLSGGEQQRVALARALMASPRLLLADEPTGNLDSRSGDAVLDLLANLRQEFPMTILIATHEQHVAARCDRLVRLRDGAVVDDIDLREGQSAKETLDRVTRLHL
jgi:putative ABC transport system ATP-binding protein